MVRPYTVRPVIVPSFPLLMVAFGGWKLGWLITLFADARISTPMFSQGIWNVLPSAALKRKKFGPYKLFLCVLPNVAEAGCTKDAVLNHWLRSWCAARGLPIWFGYCLLLPAPENELSA